MSTRGVNFFDKWLSENLPDDPTGDPVVISDLADKAMKAADQAGIPASDIEDEIGSVFEAIFDAMKNREGGLAA